MAEDARSLAELKKYLEERAESLERELRLVRTLIRLVDQSLSSQSFVRASELPPSPPERAEAPPPPPPPPPRETVDLESATQVLPVTSRTGELLAKIYVFPDKLVIRPEKPFHSSTSPFNPFFVRKVLEGFKRKAEDLVAQGAIRPEEAFDYNVVEEDGVIKEIVIRNYGGPDNLREIRSTLRWTLNKMAQREGLA